jgi:hypothetical protein
MGSKLSNLFCPKLEGSILHFPHPFATKVLIPSDLHVLSILLAFILSQDKTHKIIT